MARAAKVKSMKDRVEEFGKEAPDGDEPTKEPEVMLNVRIPKRLLKPLKVYVAQEETTVKAFMAGILERELKDRGAL